MKLFSRFAGLLLVTAIFFTPVFPQGVAQPQPAIPTDVRGLIAAVNNTTDRTVYTYISALAQLNDPAGNAALLVQLKSNNSSQIRQSIARSLAVIKNDDKIVDGLAAALKDPAPLVRGDAFQSLCTIANPRSIPNVIAYINTEPDPKQKTRLYTSLARFGAAAVDPLLDIYKTADATLKPQILQILAQTRDERAIDPLLTAYANETNMNAKSMLIYSMSMFTSNKLVLDTLLEAVKSKDTQISKIAISTIANQNDPAMVAPLLNVYPTITPGSKVVMLEAISRMPDPRYTTCILGLKDDAENVRVQAAATLGLLKNDRAIGPLKNLLEKDPSNNVKIAAAFSLAQLKADGIADILLGMLNDTDVNVREKAIRALALLGEKRAVPQITKMLTDPEPRIKFAAFSALGTIKNPGSLKALGQIVTTGDLQTRILAVRTIGQIGDAKGAEYLLPLLNEQDYSLRSAAVRALGDIKSIESIPVLLILLDEKNTDPQQQFQANALKNTVFNALGNIADPASVPVVLDMAIVKETANAATNALRTMGKVAAPALVEALGGDSPEKKQVAIDAIGNTGSQDAVPLLFKIAADKTNPYMAISAVRALGELKTSGANVGDTDNYLNMLYTGTRSVDSKISNESFHAFGTLKSDRSVGILTLLKTANPQYSQQVYLTLGQIATPTAVQTLIAMKTEATDNNVKIQIISILGRTGDASAIPSLTEDLNNSALKATAQYAIRQLTGEIDPKTSGVGGGGGIPGVGGPATYNNMGGLGGGGNGADPTARDNTARRGANPPQQ